MKINEVEQAVGITKKNIRFYEKEGLLHPARNLENGYREYTKKDVEDLKKIKLLRKLSVPIEEIRKLQSGRLVLEDCLKRHLIVLEREQKNLEQIHGFCQHMTEEGGQIETLDAAAYLMQMEQMEQEGMQFMNVKRLDQKKRKWNGALLAGGVMMLFCIWFIVIMIWAMVEEPLPAGPALLVALLLLLPLVVVICIVCALVQRKKEIQEGEEDAASKY